MGIPYGVIWTVEAQKNLQSILTYLRNNWSSREVHHFLELLQEREKHLAHYPKAYPLSKKGNDHRRSVLTRQITIYYKFEEETDKISTLFDTRQHPDKLKL